jgi:apolipoprotein D and lipocalin family protein
MRKPIRTLLIVGAAMVALGGCAVLQRGPVGNPAVPAPTKPVDVQRYAGLWYELGRYENGFERNCEAVTARYALREDGEVSVLNTCRRGGVDGPESRSEGRARIVEDSGGARLKVSFFGPFYVGDYWVLDRADDYAWSIVGEPSGRYLWLLSRTPDPDARTRALITERARALGYDMDRVRWTRHADAD